MRSSIIPAAFILSIFFGCDSQEPLPPEPGPFPDSLAQIPLRGSTEGVIELLGAATDSSRTQCFAGFTKEYARADGGEIEVTVSTDYEPPSGVAAIRLTGGNVTAPEDVISIGSARSAVLQRAGDPATHFSWKDHVFDRYELDDVAVEIDYVSDRIEAIELQLPEYRRIRDGCLPLPLRVGQRWDYEIVEAGGPLEELEDNHLNAAFTTETLSRERIGGNLYYRLSNVAGFSSELTQYSFDTLLVRLEETRVYAWYDEQDTLLFDFEDRESTTYVRTRTGTMFGISVDPPQTCLAGPECVAWWSTRTGYTWVDHFERGRGRTVVVLEDNGLHRMDGTRWALKG